MKFLKKALKVLVNPVINPVINPVKSPIANLTESFVDNVFRDKVKPVKGSVLYCDLLMGNMEHSGIYVGGGKDCIVELHNDNGTCIIQKVTPQQFMEKGTAVSIYVSCSGHDPVGKKRIAKTALSMVGQNLGRYSLLSNNCHMFTDYCLRCGDKKNQECYEWTDYLKHYANREMTLTYLKESAEEILGADTWRVWDR